MKVLIIGSGGREHAIAWKIAQSPALSKLYVAPGNPGTAAFAENVPLKAEDIDGLLAFAKAKAIDLTLVGPETPLVMGLADRFAAEKLAVFGPDQAGAKLEGSKLFAKRFMMDQKIPTANFRSFRNPEEALIYLKTLPYPCVIKADGLAAGKGVIIASDREAANEAIRMIMVEQHFGAAGEAVVVEEYIDGEEASLLAITDGDCIIPFLPAQDHKRVFDNDRGPNTGGMGAYAPTPLITPQLMAKVTERILQPTLAGIQEHNMKYCGIIYVGLMIVDNEPFVLEYNCRFGDPETQAVLPLLDSDLLELAAATIRPGALGQQKIRWKNQSAVCVVAASAGYPGNYSSGKVITGLETPIATPEAVVFQAGTALNAAGQLVTNGGRVLGVTGLAPELRQAQANAYAALKRIDFEGMFYRRDIGNKAFDYA